MLRRRLLPLLALLALPACGTTAPDTGADSAPALTATPSTPAPPTTPAVGARRYTRTLEAYCAGITRALARLAGSTTPAQDPAAPIAALARELRAEVETLGRLSPPRVLRAQHALVLAQGREASDRLDTGAQLARAGDTDAATAALLDLQDLLPALPASLRRAAPACA